MSRPFANKSANPASTQTQAPSSRGVHAAKYGYSAADADNLGFKKSDAYSNDEEWWSVQLKSTGEKGNIPSDFVVEKNSLETNE